MIDLEKQDHYVEMEWSRWITHWNQVDEPQIGIGLLHCGFSTKIRDRSEETERLCFYLKLADGHAQMDPAFGPRLRRKAFECLAYNFFFRGPAYTAALPPDALRTLLWFLRPDPKSFPKEEGGLYNFWRRRGQEDASDKALDLTMSFLTKLIQMIWHGTFFESKYWRLNGETLCLARAAKPQLLEIVHAAKGRQLMVLVRDQNVYGFTVDWNSFDQPSLDKLKELGLAQEDWFNGKRRKANSIQEAIYLNSIAAQLYILCEIAQAESKRLDSIREAEEQIRESQHKLERLSLSSH